MDIITVRKKNLKVKQRERDDGQSRRRRGKTSPAPEDTDLRVASILVLGSVPVLTGVSVIIKR